eukprot:3902748-Lingulodinium_polyedra.AAC.1
MSGPRFSWASQSEVLKAHDENGFSRIHGTCILLRAPMSLRVAAKIALPKVHCCFRRSGKPGIPSGNSCDRSCDVDVRAM